MTPQHQRRKSNLSAHLRDSVCDACTARPPAELFESRPFARRVIGAPVVIRYLDQWAFCPTCAGLVRSRSWQALVARVANSTRDTLGVPDTVVRAELADLFDHLDRHLTGRVTPLRGAA